MRIEVEVERGKGLVSTFFRGLLIEISIGVFIRIIAFYLVFRLCLSGSCFVFATPFPENRDEVPENFSKRLNFLIGLRQAHARQATDPPTPRLRRTGCPD